MRIGQWVLIATALVVGPVLAHERPGREEIKAERAALFAEADADGDVALTLEEFKSFKQLVHRRMAERHFDAIDANDDGAVSLEELQAFRPRRHRGCFGRDPGGPEEPAS